MHEDATALSKRIANETMTGCEMLLQVSRRAVQLRHPLIGELRREFRVKSGSYTQNVGDARARQDKLV